MIGGLMKTTSRFALAAAAGLFVGAMAFTPAQAADLGGDCCADLEERVAELEATTVRKGNRVVSVQIYGQVNKALVIWDDGEDSDLYMTDNDVSSSRFGIRGKGTIKPGWTAGYRFEFEIDSAASETVGQDDSLALDLGSSGDDGKGNNIGVRRSEMYIESEQYGRVAFGLASMAADDITLINLGGVSGSGQDNDFNQGFLVRSDAFGDDLESFAGGLAWGDIAPGRDRGREDGVRYDTPSIYGFIVSAGWAEDDYADVSLRFSKEWNSIRVAAGISYLWDGDDVGNDDKEELESVRGSISVMHTPSGVYGTFAAVHDEFEDSGDDFEDELKEGADPSFYYFQLGISRNWTGHGNTIIYGEYAMYEDYGVGTGLTADLTEDDDGDIAFNDAYVTDSEVTYWGFGVEQKFDSAALSLFANFKYYDADELSVTGYGEYDGQSGDIDAEEWFAVVLGSKIKF